MKKQAVAGTDGDKYIPYENREGQESVVYFTANLSAEGLLRIRKHRLCPAQKDNISLSPGNSPEFPLRLSATE